MMAAPASTVSVGVSGARRPVGTVEGTPLAKARHARRSGLVAGLDSCGGFRRGGRRHPGLDVLDLLDVGPDCTCDGAVGLFDARGPVSGNALADRGAADRAGPQTFAAASQIPLVGAGLPAPRGGATCRENGPIRRPCEKVTTRAGFFDADGGSMRNNGVGLQHQAAC